MILGKRSSNVKEVAVEEVEERPAIQKTQEELRSEMKIFWDAMEKRKSAIKVFIISHCKIYIC
jgi:hypothetical protein